MGKHETLSIYLKRPAALRVALVAENFKGSCEKSMYETPTLKWGGSIYLLEEVDGIGLEEENAEKMEQQESKPRIITLEH